jgi:transposase
MANLLNLAMVELILNLHRRGWSQRRIADELGIRRETVARYIRLAEGAPKPAIAPIGSEAEHDAPKPAIAPIGSEGEHDVPKPAIAPIGSEADQDPPEPTTARLGPSAGTQDEARGRRSNCEPLRAVIQAGCDRGLSAQRIYQDLVTEQGFTGSYYSVRRFVRRLEPEHKLPFRRLEREPGEEAQVDFGKGAPIIGPDGKRKKTHVFRIVLSFSRKAYSEVVYRQTTDDFLRCLENAFRHFGGAPRCLVLDNLRAAVSKPDWFDPEINPKVRSFGEYYGAAFWPTRPYTPRHKGKVEKSIDYVQDNGLKGRTFTSLEEENRFLASWEATVADTRLHGTTRKQVGKLFTEIERSTLLPLPAAPFPSFSEGRRSVHRDGHVEVAHAYYSVPPEYLTREVWVRWDARTVRIFNHRMEQIIVHARQEPGRFRTLTAHIASEKISGVERGTAWQLGRVRGLGSHSTDWAEAMLEARGIEGVRVLQGLLSLAGKHPVAAIDRACEIARSYGAYHLRTIRALIAHDAPKQESLPFLSEHPMIRPLSDYSQFVHDVFQSREMHE